jgi:hypothetical protein
MPAVTPLKSRSKLMVMTGAVWARPSAVGMMQRSNNQMRPEVPPSVQMVWQISIISLQRALVSHGLAHR